MALKKPKPKKCRVCKNTFEPWVSTTQVVCSGNCAIELTRLKNEKAYKTRTRELRKQQKDNDKSYQRQRADYYFNRYIRLRDSAEPCISCQRHHSGQYHAGHYRTKKACSARRYCEDNTNRQCQPCNEKLSGNITEYRKNLIVKIGTERVEAIENDNRVVRLAIDDYKEIQRIYKAKCRDIEG